MKLDPVALNNDFKKDVLTVAFHATSAILFVPNAVKVLISSAVEQLSDATKTPTETKD